MKHIKIITCIEKHLCLIVFEGKDQFKNMEINFDEIDEDIVKVDPMLFKYSIPQFNEINYNGIVSTDIGKCKII